MLYTCLELEFCKDSKSVEIMRIRLRNRQKISFYDILELMNHRKSITVDIMLCTCLGSEFYKDSKSDEIAIKSGILGIY